MADSDAYGLGESQRINVGDVTLHAVIAGSGPLVILLHGFPECWYSWRLQIPALAAAGYRVVAPDLRGYNLSDKPRRVSDYRVEALADDVAGLIRALGAEKAHVVGHDWGAMVAWVFAMRHPSLLDRLAILNVPHPARYMKSLRTLRQVRKSWYVFFFQLPWLPERGFTRDNFRALRNLFRYDPMRKGAFTDEDIERCVAAAAQPGAMTAAINYYRASVRRGPWAARRILRVIEAPTLVIWGEHDRYLGSELAEPDRHWVPNCQISRFLDASHWVQVDRPDRVNSRLIGFLG